jgi:hypothetical protein
MTTNGSFDSWRNHFQNDWLDSGSGNGSPLNSASNSLPGSGNDISPPSQQVATTASASQESTNWSGAAITNAPGESFSTVSAQWVVPTIAQVPISSVTTSDVAEWVGIDGYQSSDVCQAGVYEEAQTANGQTTLSCQAWVEWYPADAEFIPLSSFDVNPGNTIKVTVETSGAGATTATFILDNETTGQTYETSLTAPNGTSLQGNSAEAIVETPEVISGNQTSQPLLSDFLNTPVVFNDFSATYSNGSAASLSSPSAVSIDMETDDVPGTSGYVQEADGSIQAASNTVTVTENEYWPGVPVGTVVAVGDFTDNGYDDLAYFNSSTSSTVLQFLNGATQIGGGQISNSPFEGLAGWAPVASGDFSDNGYSDLVYYNPSLGVTELQFLNGTTATGGGEITNSPFEFNPSWSVVGVGDFTNNGFSDLVYYNASLGETEVQFLNSTTATGGGEITNGPFEFNPSWSVVGVGDFTNNGFSDLVYYNASLGETEVQFLNGTTATGGGEITNGPFEFNPSWNVVGVGDFNHDGYSDLVYYNANLGETEVQFLNGTTATGGGEITNSPFEFNPSWTVVGVGDFTDDGFDDDLVYYNASTGVYELQELNGTTATSTQPIPSAASLAVSGDQTGSTNIVQSQGAEQETDVLPAIANSRTDSNLGGATVSLGSPMELPFSGSAQVSLDWTSLAGGNFSPNWELANAGQSEQSLGSAGGLSEIVPPMSSFFSAPASMAELSPTPSDAASPVSIVAVSSLQHTV